MNTEAIVELLKKTTEFSKNGGTFEEFAGFVISNFDFTLKKTTLVNVKNNEVLRSKILAIKENVQEPNSIKDLVSGLTGSNEKQNLLKKSFDLLVRQTERKKNSQKLFETALSENHLSNQFWRVDPNSEGKEMIFGAALPTTVPIEKFFVSGLLEGFQSIAERTEKMRDLYSRAKKKMVEILNKKNEEVMFDIDEESGKENK